MFEDIEIGIKIATNGFVVSCDDGEVIIAKTKTELLEVIDRCVIGPDE